MIFEASFLMQLFQPSAVTFEESAGSLAVDKIQMKKTENPCLN